MVAGFMRGGAEGLESKISPGCGRDQGRQVRVSEQGDQLSQDQVSEIWKVNPTATGDQRRDLGRETGG